MEAPQTSQEPQERPLLVCLLPARNAAADLPGYFESVRQCCDAVIALDDGSTDATADLLAQEPLVKILLRNPRRDDYQGWDDAANRNRLLAAAEALNPEWIISIDADERLDEPDARALRHFLETDALPGCAYGFRHVPMREDATHFLPKYQWIYRLFSFEPGQRFPDQRLHFIPIPKQIPRRHWVKTTLRLQHLGGLTPDRRLARFGKYLEADPSRKYQSRYSPLLDSPTGHRLRVWQPRPASMPVLLGSQSEDLDSTDNGAGNPQCSFSVIVISRNDEATIAESIEAIVTQQCPEPFEVILVTSGTDRTAEIVRTQFPQVKVIALPKPALPGEARNVGLRAATGRYVTFPGSHVVIRPGNLAARLESHRRGYAMVTGVVENGTRTTAGWASYFLDHSEGLPGHPSAALNGPPAHCSYARLPLMEVGGFPEGVRTAEDTMVNRELARRGYVGYRNARVRFEHRSPCTTWPILIRHHYARGRGWGRLVVMDHQEEGQLITRDFLASRLILHIPSRLRRIDRGVSQALPELQQQFLPVRPGVLAGVVASWAGMWSEILRPDAGKLSLLFGQPRQTVLVATTDGTQSAHLVQIDHVTRRVTANALPRSLLVPSSTGEPVPLDTLIRSALAPTAPASQRDERQTTRELLNRFFDIDNLEYLILRNTELPVKAAPSQDGSSLLRSLTLVTRLARAFWRMKTRKIVTSMNAWELTQYLDAMSPVAPENEKKS